MTPEERQEKIDFILASHANSAVRMDKLEGDLAQMREDHEKSIGGLRRLAHQFLKMSQADYRAFTAEHRAQMAQHQAHMAEINAERSAREAENRARMAEIEAERVAREAELQAEREHRKAAEGRVDGIEEMTKLLRELLENNLRRPEKPPEATN